MRGLCLESENTLLISASIHQTSEKRSSRKLGFRYTSLLLSVWQVGLPKEAGSKEHKMSIFPTRILLATDGSEEATLAAQTAIDLANKTGSELHVVYTDMLPYSTALYEGYQAGVDAG